MNCTRDLVAVVVNVQLQSISRIFSAKAILSLKPLVITSILLFLSCALYLGLSIFRERQNFFRDVVDDSNLPITLHVLAPRVVPLRLELMISASSEEKERSQDILKEDSLLSIYNSSMCSVERGGRLRELPLSGICK